MDEQLEADLIEAARKNPPIAYLINGNTFRLLSAALGDVPAVRSIIQESDGGIILFGYQDNTDMKPITDILDQVPRLHYHSIEVAGGKKLYIMSHIAARNYLPQPYEISSRRTPKGCFDNELTTALQRCIQTQPDDPQHSRINPTGRQENWRE